MAMLPAFALAQENPSSNPPPNTSGDAEVHINQPPPGLRGPGLHMPPTASSSESGRPVIMPISAKGQLLPRPIGLNGNRVPPLASSSISFNASTTRPGPDNIREQIDQRRNELKNPNQGSSTERGGMPLDPRDGQGLRNDKRELQVDIFKLQQDNIAKQLNQALDNLKQVRGRIQTRITKAEQSGKNMDSAKALLTIADDKITAAESAIANFEAYTPTASSTVMATSTSDGTTTRIQLEKPRRVGAAAIQAVKDAKDALNNVVVSIAQSMGLKLGDENNADRENQATTTPVACTQDAKMCPDGSYVSRTGPRCEFKACPGLPISTTTPVTAVSTTTKKCKEQSAMGPNGLVTWCGEDLPPGQVY